MLSVLRLRNLPGSFGSCIVMTEKVHAERAARILSSFSVCSKLMLSRHPWEKSVASFSWKVARAAKSLAMAGTFCASTSPSPNHVHTSLRS